jgi:hypothetical protein
MKTKNLFLMMIAAATMVFAGCKNDDEEIASVLTIDPTAISATADAASYTVGVTSNVAWTAAVNSEAATWCTLTNASGNGNAWVTVNVAENLVVEVERVATITFTAGTLIQTVSVTQTTASPALSVSPASISATVATDNYSIVVTSNVTWTAEASAGATWCTVSPATGTGDGTVTVSVAENAAVAPRAATVTVTSGTLIHVVSVTQAGIPTPTYAASTRTWVFGNQTWSDAIRIPECNKTSFTNSSTDPHCVSFTENNNTWYYYNWSYVVANAATLCPSPWRAPEWEDFSVLYDNTTATELGVEWGYGGYASSTIVVSRNTHAYYWNTTDLVSIFAYCMQYTGSNLYVDDAAMKDQGMQVRCVK